MIENKSLSGINELMHLTLTEGAISEEQCLDEIAQIIKLRNKTKIERSKLWDGLKKMPPLYHKLPDEDFALEKSEVIKWIGQDIKVMDWVMRSAGKNGLISYDKETRQWKGIEWEEQK